MVRISEQRTRRTKFEARRREILRAAGEAFRERGFQAAGMRDIARRAGLSTANLYYYFASKDELLYACQDLTLDRLLAAAKRRPRGATADERLRAVIEAQVTCMLDQVGGGAAHIAVDALPAELREQIVTKRDEYERAVRRIIDAGVRQGCFRAPRGGTTLATRALLGALNWTAQWYRPGGALTTEDIALGLADTLLGGLTHREDEA